MNELLIALSLMPCVVVQKYCSLWPCRTSACLIISVTVVDELTFRAEFYDFILFILQ